MITTKNADNALKTFYLDAVAKAIDTRTNPFLAQIERTSVGVSGKEVRKLVRYGLNGAVATGTETGDLPSAYGNQYVQLVSTLKNIYGTIEISDKALRASQNDEGALINLLNAEMEGLVESAKYQFDRMLFGDGSGRLTEIDYVCPTYFTVANTSPLMEGMLVSIGPKSNPKMIDNLRILKVNRTQREVVFDREIDCDELEEGMMVFMCGGGEEITGLIKIFESEHLYGLDKKEYPLLRPQWNEAPDGFTEDLISKTMDKIEEMSGTGVNMMLCNYGVRRAIEYYFKDMGTPLNTVDLGNGFKALEYKGIPIIASKHCLTETLYLINTNDFKLCQLCDWQWMESENGDILRQVPGKPVYTATLVKYAELICERPYAQGYITGIIER